MGPRERELERIEQDVNDGLIDGAEANRLIREMDRDEAAEIEERDRAREERQGHTIGRR